MAKSKQKKQYGKYNPAVLKKLTEKYRVTVQFIHESLRGDRVNETSIRICEDYKIMESQRQIEIETNTAVGLYTRYLEEAVYHFEQGQIDKARKSLIDANSVYPESALAGQNFINRIWYLWPIYYHYEYLCDVKQQKYQSAFITYNRWILKNNDSSDPDFNPEKLLPFTTENYFSSNPKDSINTLENRFRADLYFVELLANTGKLNEAQEAMLKVMEFYTSKINSLDKFSAQIAISHFYSGNIEQARKYMEYYCNTTESYAARYAITEELLKPSDNIHKWNYALLPEGFKMMEENIQFLSDVYKKSNNDSELFKVSFWYELYVCRSSNEDKFVETIKPYLPNELKAIKKDIFREKQTIQYYLLALKKQNNETGIKNTIQQLAAIAHEIYESEKKAINSKMEYANTFKSTDPKKYWELYYNHMAAPAANALRVFILPEFCKTGGPTYLKKAAKPYVKELAGYTADEAWFNWDHPMETCGILLKFKKSRKYSNKTD